MYGRFDRLLGRSYLLLGNERNGTERVQTVGNEMEQSSYFVKLEQGNIEHVRTDRN